MNTIKPGGRYHGMDGGPARHPAPRPWPFAMIFSAAGLYLANAMHHVERL
jgi:hypothetical protein